MSEAVEYYVGVVQDHCIDSERVIESNVFVSTEREPVLLALIQVLTKLLLEDPNMDPLVKVNILQIIAAKQFDTAITFYHQFDRNIHMIRTQDGRITKLRKTFKIRDRSNLTETELSAQTQDAIRDEINRLHPQSRTQQKTETKVVKED